MRYLLWLLVVALFIVTISCALAGGYGKVVYISATPRYRAQLERALNSDDYVRPTFPLDIKETDLNSGKTSLLISHSCFPRDFNTSITLFTVSPGSGDVIFGQDNHLWVWHRKTRKFEVVVGQYVGYSQYFGEQVSWSPSGRCVAMMSPQTSYLVYDTLTHKSRGFTLKGDVPTELHWRTDNSIIEVENPDDPPVFRAYVRTIGTGRRVKLREWPRHAVSAPWDSRFRNYVAGVGWGDRKYFIKHASTRKPRKLNIPTDVTNFTVDFLYNKPASRLVALSEQTWTGSNEDTFWSVNPTTGKCLKLGDWSYMDAFRPGDSSFAPTRHPQGRATGYHGPLAWLGDNKTVILGGAAGDNEVLYALDVSKRHPKFKRVFESGPACIGFCWWPGEFHRANPGSAILYPVRSAV